MLLYPLSRNQTNDFSVIRDWVPYSNTTRSVKWLNFHLQHKDKVKVNLRTTNGALNTIVNTTNGFVVDLTPPTLISLGDGLEPGKDIEFQVKNLFGHIVPLMSCKTCVLLFPLFCDFRVSLLFILKYVKPQLLPTLSFTDLVNKNEIGVFQIGRSSHLCYTLHVSSNTFILYF